MIKQVGIAALVHGAVGVNEFDVAVQRAVVLEGEPEGVKQLFFLLRKL